MPNDPLFSLYDDEKSDCIRPWHGYLDIDLFTLKHGWIGPSHDYGKDGVGVDICPYLNLLMGS